MAPKTCFLKESMMRSLRQSENVRYSRDKKPGRFWNSMSLTSTKCLWLSLRLAQKRGMVWSIFLWHFCLFFSPFSFYQEIEQADTCIGERRKEMRRVRKLLQEGTAALVSTCLSGGWEASSEMDQDSLGCCALPHTPGPYGSCIYFQVPRVSLL